MEHSASAARTRTRVGVKGRALALALAPLMLATGLLTACQPTPKAVLVVNKDEYHLEDIIASMASAAQPQERNKVHLAALEAALREYLRALKTFADIYQLKEREEQYILQELYGIWKQNGYQNQQYTVVHDAYHAKK